VSEQQSEAISVETGSVGAGPAAPDMMAPAEPVTAQATADIKSPRLAPQRDETAPKPDAPGIETVKVEAPKLEAVKPEAVKPEAPRFPGNVMIMSPGDRAWNGDSTGSKAEAETGAAPSGKRRMSDKRGRLRTVKAGSCGE
jgi:hypothetical protein